MRTTRLAAITSGLALTAGAVVGIPLSASATAAPRPGHKPAACAQQQKQVDKAEDALARAIANVERQQKTKAPKPGAAKPTKPTKLDRAAKEKKAQVQRLAKAQERLAACRAAQG